jgi:hypothetical protein
MCGRGDEKHDDRYDGRIPAGVDVCWLRVVCRRGNPRAGARPCLPGFYLDDPLRLEEAFGWAMCDLLYRRRGWMSIVQQLYQIEDVPSEAA